MPTTTNAAARVGANIRAELARRSLTQTDLGVHLGLGNASIHGRLHGKIPINVNELEAIATYLGVDLATLTA